MRLYQIDTTSLHFEVYLTLLILSKKKKKKFPPNLNHITFQSMIDSVADFQLIFNHVFSYFSQVESEGSRSGSSLSLRNMTGGTTSTGGTHTSGTGGSGAQTSQSPSHGTNNSSGSSSSSHNRVQRSISATSSKPRRGSTGAQDPNASAAGKMSYERFRTEIVINFSRKT